MKFKIAKRVFAAAMLLGSLQVSASVINDPSGDYVNGYNGSKIGDLDVLSALVNYNPASDIFHFESTLAENIGSSASGFYIWGFNRGAGTARFAANGLPNVLFDSVVRFNNDGSGSITLLAPTAANTVLAAGTVIIQGNVISADIAGNLLPSAGFAESAYTWNLWPRDGTLPSGFGQISDFAPDNTNAAVQVVPLPASMWLFSSALGFLTLSRKRRNGLARTTFW